MSNDLVRLHELLQRLRELDLRLPLPHERPILDVARMSLCEEISRLSHALHDLDYNRTPQPQRRVG